MSRLDELIAELCPDGVPYNRLVDVCKEIIVPMRDRPKDLTGHIPWCRIEDKEGQFFNGSLSGLGVTEETIKKMNLKVFPTGTVICSCSASIGAYAINTQPLITNQTFIGLVCGDKLFNKYLLYYMETQTRYLLSQASTGTIPYISRKKFEDMQIPIPPLPVQHEIVRILDSFTEHTAELTAELNAELTARKKQYEYYQNTVLTFDASTPMLPLNDVILSLNTGLNPRQFFKLNTEDAKNFYITIREIRNGIIAPTEKTDRINDDALRLCNNRSNLDMGDVLFSGTGTIGETAVVKEKPSNWNIKEGVYAIKPNPQIMNSSFLRYILMSKEARQAYMKKVAGGTVKSIPMAELKKIKVPVPPITVQNRIVALLDRFDTLYNDIINGLPAEITARQKQYEYYRDKLLTFKPLV